LGQRQPGCQQQISGVVWKLGNPKSWKIMKNPHQKK
jgi:hypothetical protein